jgi:hypothetical protein
MQNYCQNYTALGRDMTSCILSYIARKTRHFYAVCMPHVLEDVGFVLPARNEADVTPTTWAILIEFILGSISNEKLIADWFRTLAL